MDIIENEIKNHQILGVRNGPSVTFGTNVPCITFTVDNENITTERDCKRNFKFFFSLKVFNSDNSEMVSCSKNVTFVEKLQL